MAGESDKLGGQKGPPDAAASGAAAAPEPSAQSSAVAQAERDARPFWKRPEICAAVIGVLGAIIVAFFEFGLRHLERQAAYAPPQTVAGSEEQTPPTVQVNHSADAVGEVNGREKIEALTRELEQASLAHDEQGRIQINGVIVDPRIETRIVVSDDALVFSEPSPLRARELQRYAIGDQVALIGKVVDAPWFAVKSGSEYGFVRTRHFSKETVGGE